MPSIRSVTRAVPTHRYSNEEILDAGRVWLRDSPQEMLLFERFVASSHTDTRSFSRPIAEVLELGGLAARASIFEEVGTRLGAQTARSACEIAACDPATVASFIFTSCSSPVIPSIDGTIVERANLSRRVTRIPIFQYGCAGGVAGLTLANKLAKNGETVLLTSVELCSLGFQARDHTAGHLVGSAIFGDGASSVVIGPENEGLVFVDTESVLTEGSRHLMGYDIHDDGLHLRLDKELPSFLANEIPALVPEFLSRNGMSIDDVDWWLFHPGGIKILNCLEEAFDIEPARARWARDVLRTYGNLSSASVLFVLADFLRAGVAESRQNVLMVGVGPGLVVQLILFRIDTNSPSLPKVAPETLTVRTDNA